MTIAAGTRFGPYEVAGLIGAGGMGEVYRATDTKLGRDAALKTLPSSLAGDAESEPVPLIAGPYLAPNSNRLVYDVSLDDEQFLMIKRTNPGSEVVTPTIVIVENWFEELERLVPTQ